MCLFTLSNLIYNAKYPNFTKDQFMDVRGQHMIGTIVLCAHKKSHLFIPYRELDYKTAFKVS